jgi:hypothetical protein
MGVLYEDAHVVCDEDGLTIKRYYFPLATEKRIPYADIRRVEEHRMGALTGQWRIWGMGPAPYWFHLDWTRPRKDRAIIVDRGSWLKVVVTPDDPEAVLRILQARAGRSGA